MEGEFDSSLVASHPEVQALALEIAKYADVSLPPFPVFPCNSCCLTSRRLLKVPQSPANLLTFSPTCSTLPISSLLVSWLTNAFLFLCSPPPPILHLSATSSQSEGC